MSQRTKTSDKAMVSTSKQKLKLKTPVRVLGRFLLLVEDEFNLAKVQELLQKSGSQYKNIKTKLKVYNLGLQLGASGLLASMPLEFIKFNRVLAVAAAQADARVLALCMSNDRYQRSVTLLQLQDAATVNKAVNIIDLGRRSAVDTTLIADPPSNRPSSNWEFSSKHEQQQQQQQLPAVSAAAGLFDKKPFIGDITKPPMASNSAEVEEVDDTEYTGTYLVAAPSNSYTEQQQLRIEQERLQLQEEQRRQQLEQRETIQRQTNGVKRRSDESYRHPSIPEHSELEEFEEDPYIDDMEAWAVFESQTGPPTLLNEVGVQIKEARHLRGDLWGRIKQQQFGYEDDDAAIELRQQQQLQQGDMQQYTAKVHVTGVWSSGSEEADYSVASASNQHRVSTTNQNPDQEYLIANNNSLQNNFVLR